MLYINTAVNNFTRALSFDVSHETGLTCGIGIAQTIDASQTCQSSCENLAGDR